MKGEEINSELDYKKSWAQKNWCFWTVVLEKTLESPLDCTEIQRVHPKGDQSWMSIGRTDAEAETPILWLPEAKSWLIGKDPDGGKDWGQEEKGTTEDEMVGWHHRLNGHGFGWTPGVGDGQGGLECCGSWGRKESDMTEWLNWTDTSTIHFKSFWVFIYLPNDRTKVPLVARYYRAEGKWKMDSQGIWIALCPFPSGLSRSADFWASAAHRWVHTALLSPAGFETNPLIVLGFDYVALKNRLIGYLIITSISDYWALSLFQNLTCFYLKPILLTLKNDLCKYNMRQRGEIKSCLRPYEWLHSAWAILFVFL